MDMRTAPPASTTLLALGFLVSLMSPLPVHSAPGDTTLVSVHYAPTTTGYSVRTLGISADGRFVLFEGDSPAFLPFGSGTMTNLLVRDRDAGTTSRANVGSNGKAVPALTRSTISADGRYVVFESNRDTVVPGDTNNQYDVFMRDLRTQTTELVSLTSDEHQYRLAFGGSPSADGRYVAFFTEGKDGNLNTIRVRDRLTKQTSSLFVKGLGGSEPLLSADGRYLVYRNYKHVVAFDRTAGTAENVNVNSNGQVANAPCQLAGVSANGRYVLFTSAASNLVPGDTNGVTDAFVRDRTLRKTQRVTLTDDDRQFGYVSPYMVASLSLDGRFVAFTVSTRNVGNYSIDDIMVRDRIAGTTRLASRNSAGAKANGHSSRPVINGDGRFVAFTSEASNLAASDTNKYADAFIHEFADAPPLPASPPKVEAEISRPGEGG
jgi:Tol biopolymer transport system component